MSSVPVVTIDGPSGAGKGTIGTRIASELGWNYLDSGSIYRLFALLAIRKNLNTDNPKEIQLIAQSISYQAINAFGEFRILQGNEDVTTEIRSNTVADKASHLATIYEVRNALLTIQKNLRQPPGLIADGRDMGTQLFPDAMLKIFLTATAEARAIRRAKQLKAQGFDANLPSLFVAINNRDRKDASRTISPLIAAKDAVHIDTTDQSIDQVVKRVIDLYRSRIPDIPSPQSRSKFRNYNA